ncbi:MAG: 3-dehydroquinate synthase [Alphaproteobacteria bacterium GM7ARS4]|nr:3-dehydroquinate synthase [Alphaproteobacteria bacterium GM7ARS4]
MVMQQHVIEIPFHETPCRIIIGRESLPSIGQHVLETHHSTQQSTSAAPPHAFIVSETIVYDLYGAQLCESLTRHKVKHTCCVLDRHDYGGSSESLKSYDALRAICEHALSSHITRDSILITLGGGVIGDVGGVAANLLLRGLPLIHVPTTLLAQVDSAIGGKTAINSRHGKNLIGTFYQPRRVVCDSATLTTLPQRHITAGYGEILKYACIKDEPFFQWLDQHATSLLQGEGRDILYAISHCAAMKADIVMHDEKEQGQRALLNLGHSFCHALEAANAFDESLLHGEGVLIGLLLAARLSVTLKHAPPSLEQRLYAHLERHQLLPEQLWTPATSLTTDTLLTCMQRDKKNRGNTMTLILMRAIGKAFIAPQCPIDPIRQTLDHYLTQQRTTPQ